jgi:hypothetical protein
MIFGGFDMPVLIDDYTAAAEQNPALEYVIIYHHRRGIEPHKHTRFTPVRCTLIRFILHGNNLED